MPGTAVCKRGVKKEKEAKETNAMDAKSPGTPPPPQHGEAANLGFFFSMEAGINVLNHVGINEFGKWAKVRVEEHPEVVVDIQPDVEGYADLKLQPRPPQKHKTTTSKSLVDTGAQMVVMGRRQAEMLGIRERDYLQAKMKIQVANNRTATTLGLAILEISVVGSSKTTWQQAYII